MGKKRDYEKITVIIMGIGLACSIGYNIFQAWQTNSLANENKQLYLDSLRADINIQIDPIEIQNWTFTQEGAFLEVKRRTS